MLIEAGRLDEKFTRHYIKQLLDGLDFCHQSGLAHRDLKPDNIMFNEKLDLKIVDFGSSAPL